MNIRVWGTSLLMFLSTVTAVGQTAKPLFESSASSRLGRESGKYFNRYFQWMTIGGSHSKTPNWTL